MHVNSIFAISARTSTLRNTPLFAAVGCNHKWNVITYARTVCPFRRRWLSKRWRNLGHLVRSSELVQLRYCSRCAQGKCDECVNFPLHRFYWGTTSSFQHREFAEESVISDKRAGWSRSMCCKHGKSKDNATGQRSYVCEDGLVCFGCTRVSMVFDLHMDCFAIRMSPHFHNSQCVQCRFDFELDLFILLFPRKIVRQHTISGVAMWHKPLQDDELRTVVRLESFEKPFMDPSIHCYPA